jgi:uncharacterized membrane protein (UPF0136 family)
MKTINPFQPMSTQMAGYLVIFGIFLILLGVIGYVTHPEKAVTALVSGGGFGALWMLWVILSAKRVRRSWLAALVTTLLLAVACVLRASLRPGLTWPPSFRHSFISSGTCCRC